MSCDQVLAKLSEKLYSRLLVQEEHGFQKGAQCAPWPQELKKKPGLDRVKLRDHSRVSNIIKAWLPFLARVLQPLMPWPSRKDVRKNIPSSFKSSKKYENICIILDCAEFKMEARPSAPSLNAVTYSDYKGRNTVKVLFGCTPDGYISFISAAYPGSITDNSMACKSGILSLLQPGDDIMTDKGFTVSNIHLEPREV